MSCRGPLRRAAAVGLILACAGSASAQGTLDDVREEVRGEEDAHHEEDDDHDEWYAEESSDALFDAFFGDGLAALFEHTLFLPWHVPRLLLADAGFAPAGFARHPAGRAPYWQGVAEGERAGRALALRPSFELGTDFDDLERTGFGLTLEHASRFGLEASWSRWREDLGAAGTDELDLGEFSLVYRFAQGPRAAFWSGVGLNVLDDRLESDFGVDLTYGALFLAGEHVTVEFDADLGTLGDATLTHLGAGLGWRIERFELFTAFDRWSFDSADLTSYALGLRGWF